MVLTIAALIAISGTAQSFEALSAAVQSLTDRVDPSVVQILTRQYALSGEDSQPTVQSRRGGGSGVIVDADGYILTNAHVIGGARRVQVLVPQVDSRGPQPRLKPRLYPAELIGIDRETDIAVLKIAMTKATPLPFADSDQLRQGQFVLAFGSPFGLTNSVSIGVISSVAREVRADDPMVYIQTDASINPGNSGGPLVTATGQLAGINTFIMSPSGGNDGVGFAVPANIVRNVYEQIRKQGYVRRGQLGIVPQTITAGLASALALEQDSGVLIGDITPRSAAESAGLAIRDIVLSLNGKPVETARQLGAAIYQHAGDTVTLDILRGSKRLTLQAAVLERPRDPGRIVSLLSGAQNLIAKLGILAVDLDERVTPLLPPLRKLSGVVVAGSVSDLSAHEDPLRTGDVIYAVNNTPVRDLEQLRAAVSGFSHGSVIALQIERSGQLQFLTMEVE